MMSLWFFEKSETIPANVLYFKCGERQVLARAGASISARYDESEGAVTFRPRHTLERDESVLRIEGDWKDGLTAVPSLKVTTLVSDDPNFWVTPTTT